MSSCGHYTVVIVILQLAVHNDEVNLKKFHKNAVLKSLENKTLK